MGWIVLGNGIPFRRGGGKQGQTYWTTHLFGEDDLSLRAGARSGNKLTATVGSDVNILLPHYKNLGTDDVLEYGGSYLDTDKVFEVGSTDLTVVAWVRSANDTNPAARYRLIGKGYNTLGKYGWYVHSDGCFAFEYAVATPDTWRSLVTTVNAMDQQWHLLVAIIDTVNKVVKLFIDNVSAYADNSYTGTFPVRDNIAFRVGSTPNANEYLAPFDFSDMWVYRSCLTAQNMTDLYNHVEVAGCLAHWSGVRFDGACIYDFSGNNYHLDCPSGGRNCVGYDSNGSRQGLEKGYDVYSSGNTLRRELPKKDDGTALTYSASGWYPIKSVAGNSGYHNLTDSYLEINHPNFDRSDTTIWGAAARNTTTTLEFGETLYMASNEFAWHIKELHRFNLYYWANTGYEGLCICKGYPNSFSLNQYMVEIISYNTNKSAADLAKIYRFTGDYEAELINDGDFSDSLSANIWRHPFGYFTFTGGKANYTGINGAQNGCLRLWLYANYIIGRRYRLRYEISDCENDNLHLWFSGDGGVQFQGETWKNKGNGSYDEVHICNWNGDDLFEIQVGISTADNGMGSIDNISLKIVEDV